MKIKLGQKVRDTITGLEGIATARTEWMSGCVRITVQPQLIKDGAPVDTCAFDEPQLEVIAEKAAPRAEPRHGSRPEAQRALHPVRW